MEQSDLLSMSVTVPAHVLIQELPDGEVVLLDLESERYFGLDEVGARIWTSVTTASSVGSALQELQQIYEVDTGSLRADVERMLDELSERGLLQVHG